MSFAISDTISKPFSDANNQLRIQQKFKDDYMKEKKQSESKSESKSSKFKFSNESKNNKTVSLSQMKGSGSSIKNAGPSSFGVFMGDSSNQCDFF